jgi:hypothetical protein
MSAICSHLFEFKLNIKKRRVFRVLQGIYAAMVESGNTADGCAVDATPTAWHPATEGSQRGPSWKAERHGASLNITLTFFFPSLGI